MEEARGEELVGAGSLDVAAWTKAARRPEASC